MSNYLTKKLIWGVMGAGQTSESPNLRTARA